MPEMQRNRSVGAEMTKITVIGAFAIAVAVIVAVLLIRHLNRISNQGSGQSPS